VRDNVRRWVQSAAAAESASIDELLEREVESALARMNLPDAREITRIHESLVRLAEAVERIEQRLSSTPEPPTP
jgi:hypothetical protein